MKTSYSSEKNIKNSIIMCGTFVQIKAAKRGTDTTEPFKIHPLVLWQSLRVQFTQRDTRGQ